MLKQRIITALWLIPLVIGGFFYVGEMTFYLFIWLIILLASWEWALLAGITSNTKRILYALVVGLIFAFIFVYSFIFSVSYFRIMSTNFIITGGIWWLFAIFLVVKFPIYFKQWAMLLIGILILLPCAYGLIMLRGHSLLLVLIGIVCLADTGAYFAGKKFGKHKLALKISPGKTIEGVLGGFVAVVIFLFACYLWLIFKSDFVATANANGGISHGLNLLLIAIFGLVLSLSSVLGDLTESMFKRLVGVKDSSNLLPGHGGVLDRIDGFTCAAPVFCLCLMLGQNFFLIKYFVLHGYG